MALNHENGEIIEDLDGPFRVVPNIKWRETPLFETAAQAAAEAFLAAGALWPIRFDDDEIVTQEYPRERKLVMVFCKTIRQKEMYYPYIFDLPHAMIAELRATGKWESTDVR